MLFNFKLDDLIPLFTIGAILTIAIYNTLLYYFSRLKVVGSYSVYLWLALSYLVLAITTVPQKTFKIPTESYLIRSSVFWLSLLAYLNFLVVVLDIGKTQKNRLYNIIKKTYLITPIYTLFRFPNFFFPEPYVATVKACGFILDAYLFFIFGYLIYRLITSKLRDIKTFIFIGSILIVFFNIFNSLTFYNQGYIFGLSYVSYIALGYFSDIIFFSLAVGWLMRENIKAKYLALAEVSQKKLELEIEKQKASDILLTQDFILETERTKTIIEQRTAIGRRLHDDLSGSLVALRFLVQDFKAKAINNADKEKFEDLEAEISNIYKEARNYSHELSKNTTLVDNKISYDVIAYLEKLAEQFSNTGLLNIHTTINQNEIIQYLNVIQTSHVYFLLKECISNTIKHSVAKNIWIDIHFNSNKCNICFSDDGGSFNALAVEGVGIKGMRSRIDELKGSLDYSTNNEETTVSICFEVDGAK